MSPDDHVNTITASAWRVEGNARAELGERPIWDENASHLIWVDVISGNIHRYDPSSGWSDRLKLDTSVGSVALCAGGGYVAATGKGFMILDKKGEPIAGPLRPPQMDETQRFNDGYCDPAGRFWAGTSSLTSDDDKCALYYLEKSGKITLALEGVAESNGIGWSPDAKKMYFVDSGGSQASVRVFDFDVDTARMSNPKVFLDAGPCDGVPDGLVVDDAGSVWIAYWGGASVRRYSPRGRLQAVYEMPLEYPTCPGFGGATRETLFVTSALGVHPDVCYISSPLAGALLSSNVMARGQPVPYFR